jgi:hypothetical protein
MADLLAEFYRDRWLNPTHLRGRTLATIEHLSAEVVGRKQERVPVLHLRNLPPLILNRTNAQRLVEAMGTPDYHQYRGRRVALYVADEDWDGKPRKVVRLEATEVPPRTAPAGEPMPEAEPEPDADAEGWEDA